MYGANNIILITPDRYELESLLDGEILAVQLTRFNEPYYIQTDCAITVVIEQEEQLYSVEPRIVSRQNGLLEFDIGGLGLSEGLFQFEVYVSNPTGTIRQAFPTLYTVPILLLNNEVE